MRKIRIEDFTFPWKLRQLGHDYLSKAKVKFVFFNDGIFNTEIHENLEEFISHLTTINYDVHTNLIGAFYDVHENVPCIRFENSAAAEELSK